MQRLAMFVRSRKAKLRCRSIRKAPPTPPTPCVFGAAIVAGLGHCQVQAACFKAARLQVSNSAAGRKTRKRVGWCVGRVGVARDVNGCKRKRKTSHDDMSQARVDAGWDGKGILAR